MAMIIPGERFCYLCDAVRPSQCMCIRIAKMTDDNLDDVQKAQRKPCGCYGPAHRPECKEIVGTKEQYGKFNTKPTTYSKDFVEQFMNKVEMSKEDKMLYDMAWNAAIEAAAEYFEKDLWKVVPSMIRELKK